MNDPAYRERYRVVTDHDNVVTATSTLDEAAMARAVRLRRLEIIGNRLGVLRHVGLFLQWDHGLPVLDLLDHLLDVVSEAPSRFPLLTWIVEYFDLHATAPVGWSAVYEELRRYLAEEHGIDPSGTDLDAVLTLQTALMPSPERTFPDAVTLRHDYLTYFRDATAALYGDGRASTPRRPLADHPPAPFTVTSDPLGLCRVGLVFDGDSRDLQFEGDFAIGQRAANELGSPLLALLPVFSGGSPPPEHAAFVAEVLATTPLRIHREVPVEAP
jgi:hypothetical protein